MARQALETEQKALEINLNEQIYGTFAEIGAGQEVARYFFQVGASSGTIAKTMSAYDKIYSDEIYGIEESGRYVCESRLYKMLAHEYDLMNTRLQTERIGSNFFAFADTISAVNFSKTIKGDGWLGIRFQLDPEGEPNEMVLHARMLDNDNRLQQQAIGILGVNLLYACYYYNDDAEAMLESLMDNLRGRISVDMIRISGPDFKNLDNRWLALMLVKHKLTDVAMFGADGRMVHASEFLYKKYILVVRGSYSPMTLVNEDVIKTSWEQFKCGPGIDSGKCVLLTELTIDSLSRTGELDEKDFLDRAELLCSEGHTVVVSDCKAHQKLIAYLNDYKFKKLGLVLGAKQLLDEMERKYQDFRNGRLLSAFGELFTTNVKMYVYPYLKEDKKELMTAENLPIHEGLKFLYQHLLDSRHIEDIKGYKLEHLHIWSKTVLEFLKKDEENWDKMVPEKIAILIREKGLFGFPHKQS